MNEELLKRLDTLAAALASTGAHLWQVLIVQARIEGVAYFGAGIVSLCGVAVLLTLIQKKKTELKPIDEIDNLLLHIGAVICSVLAVFLLFQAASNLLNPEYYALQQLLRLARLASK